MKKKTPELIESLIKGIEEGKGIRTVCKENNISWDTFSRYLHEDAEFSARYVRAKELLMERMAEEIIEISDDDSFDETAFVGINHIHRAKLKVDTRKWLMSKLAPKKYGDKLDITSGSEKITAVQVEIVRRKEETDTNPENAGI